MTITVHPPFYVIRTDKRTNRTDNPVIPIIYFCADWEGITFVTG